MKNFETAFYAGIGMALKGKEKAAEVAKKIVKDSKMEAKEGKKFIDKAVKQAEAAKKELSKKIDETVKTTFNKMGYISKKEADALKTEIKKLKSEVQKYKKSKK